MKRQGSILILTILVFVVVLIVGMYVLYLSTIHMHIAQNKNRNNQGFYTSEAKIYMCMYEDKYFKNQLQPLIVNEFRKTMNNPKDYILLAAEDLDVGDSEKKVSLSFEMQNNRKCLKLLGKTENNNQTTNASSVFTIVREIFELGLPVLHQDYLNQQDQEEVLDYMNHIASKISLDNIASHINRIDFLDYEKIRVNTIYKRDMEMLYIKNDQVLKVEPFIHADKNKVKEFFILMEDKYHKEPELHIESDNLTSMDGVLYIHGDLVISSEFVFNGIIIINKGRIIVNSEINPIINGIIISNGEEGWIDLDRVTINYDRQYIYRYGTYLPDFLDYEFLVLKKTK